MHILGFDYGTKRIGVALAVTPLAEPLTIINHVPSDDSIVGFTVLEQIQKLIRDHQAEMLVVGVSEGAMAIKCKAFALLLREATGLPVVEVDETLSSAQALDYSKHMRQGKKRAAQDDRAATLILQEYLDFSA